MSLVRFLTTRAVLVGLALTLTAAPASADWLLTPYLGIAFGGTANFGDQGDLEDNFEKRMTFGAAIGTMGNGVVGFEVDFGSTPNFFEATGGGGNFGFGDSNLTTLMANVLIGIPIGGQTGAGVRPYIAAGGGLLRANIDAGNFFDELSTSDLGINVGGGAHVFFTDTLGMRGDVRYFRSLQDHERDGPFDLGLSDFTFWRGTVGVTIRF